MKDAAKRIQREGKTLLVECTGKTVVCPPKPTDIMNVIVGTVINPIMGPIDRVVINEGKELENGNAMVSEVTLNDNSCNESSITSWNVEVFPSLHILTIGRNCLGNLKEFALCNLSRLKLVEVGAGSLASCAELRITDCGLLENIDLKDNSFATCQEVCLQSGTVSGG